MTRCLLAFLFIPSLLSAQGRKDDQPPHIKPLSTITAITGWTKNDLGKWSSSPNALPRYLHDYYFPTCEHILRIDLTEVQYKDKTMFCLAKFMESKYIRLNKIHIEYPVDYWLFDLSRTDTLIGENTMVQSITFHTIGPGFFSGATPATWKDLSNDIIVHFDNPIGLEGYFCIQSREDKKNNKTQFLFGSYDPAIQRYNFNDCLMPGDNNQFDNGYYEVPASIFTTFIKKLKN